MDSPGTLILVPEYDDKGLCVYMYTYRHIVFCGTVTH